MRLRDVGLLSAGLLVFATVPAHAQRGMADILRDRIGARPPAGEACTVDRDGRRICRAEDGVWRRRDDGRSDPSRRDGRYDGRTDSYSAAHAELHRRMEEAHAAWHRAHRNDRDYAAEHAEYHRQMERAHQAWHDRARREANRGWSGIDRRDDGRPDDWDGYGRADERHDNGRHLGWEKQTARGRGRGPRG